MINDKWNFTAILFKSTWKTIEFMLLNTVIWPAIRNEYCFNYLLIVDVEGAESHDSVYRVARQHLDRRAYYAKLKPP